MPGYRRRVPSNRALDKKIRKLQGETELKYNDHWLTVVAGNNPDTEDNVYVLNNTSAGTGVLGNRIGNEIYITSLQYRGFIYINNIESVEFVDAIRAPFMRVIFFWDSVPDGNSPVILGSSAAGIDSLLDISIPGASPIWAPYNPSTANRFRILSDNTYSFGRSSEVYYVVDNETMYTNAVPSKFISDKISLGRTTKYNDDGGTVASVSQNGLFVTFISTYDQSPTQNYSISFDGYIRVIYKDA